MRKDYCVMGLWTLLGWSAALLPCQANNEGSTAASEGPGSPDIARTEEIDEVEVTATYKGTPLQDLRPTSNTTLYLRRIEQLQIEDVKDLSSFVPNLHIPDYGSRMTSSVYVRGLGSRMDQPAMGLYVDGIPYFNKNGFDFEFADIRSITVLRGPQSSLYGRNTMGGVIDIKTLSPLDFQGLRFRLDYGNANSLRLKTSYYHMPSENFGAAYGVYVNHTDGFFDNATKDRKCDDENSLGGQVRLEGKALDQRLHWSNILQADALKQGGYAYRQLTEQEGHSTLQPVNYNDSCGYRRTTLRDGLTVDWKGDRWRLQAATSYQLLDDEMNLDQDFTPLSFFTLTQKQQEHTLSQDVVLRPVVQGNWQWLTGLNLWGRHQDMQAPVTFKETGIQNLILNNANKGIQMFMPDAQLEFQEHEFVIGSDFTTRSYGIALYHNSSWTLDRWKMGAGLRIEHEGQHFDYNSDALIHYRVDPTEAYKPLATVLKGSEKTNFWECTPSLSVDYTYKGLTWHTSVARGYKSGGFNTQLFSDLLQQRMMTNLIGEFIFLRDEETAVGDVITYKPEYSWNFETGVLMRRSHWQGSATVFYIACRDQQLTVFPDGMQTGRMMTNAGKTASWGMELEGSIRPLEGLNLAASYGYTHSTFKRFNDGKHDYAGNFVPYAPQQTLSLQASYAVPLPHDDWALDLQLNCKGVGPIYWDEANEVKEDLYATLGGSIELRYKQVGVSVWGKNLTDAHYNTFYFVSMQNRFLQQGKPLQVGVSMKFTLF